MLVQFERHCPAPSLEGIEPALRLYAAATAAREPYGLQHTVPAVLADEERVLVPARSQLGAEQRLAAESEGQKLTLEEAVEYALSRTIAPL